MVKKRLVGVSRFRMALAFAVSLMGVGAMSTPTAMAQEAEKEAPAAKSLTLGEAAPTLDIELWLKGTKLSQYEPGKVYVVEFWATWCGPCKKSIPHLNELQAQYGDKIQIVGVSDEEKDTVQGYLDTHQKDLAYTIATDPSAATKKAFMDAYGVQGIPSAFLIDKQGRLAWVGHPMKLDGVLQAVVEDNFDAISYQRWQERHDALEALYKEAAAAERWQDALSHLDEMLALHAEDSSDLFGSGDAHQRHRFEILLAKLWAVEEAYAYGETLLVETWDDANELNNLAWFIVDAPGLPERDLDLAMRASVRSNLLSQGKNAAYLDTLARVYFEAGDLDAAIRYQEDAVKHVGNRNDGGITATLERYRAHAGKSAPAHTSGPRNTRNRKGLRIPTSLPSARE